MRHSLGRAALAFLAVGVLAIGAAPAVASGPAIHFTVPVTGDVIVCDTETYTITSGEIKFVIHEGAAAQGNENFTATITPVKVVAEDESGNEYSVVGAFWFGGTFNANTGGFQETFTGKIQIVRKGGGTADSVNITFHITAQPNNFFVNEFDFGTCEEPT
jgi:hypothetical protein